MKNKPEINPPEALTMIGFGMMLVALNILFGYAVALLVSGTILFVFGLILMWIKRR